MEIVTQDAMWKMEGCVQHYSWGGREYLPNLINLANDQGRPFAELWFGQHPSCHSKASGGTLDDLITSSPELFFTPEERSKWGDELPFLCKILDVQDMLSIQIHPDQEQALRGFGQEEDERIPQTAANRTFRDQNHKPELMYALSEFYLLHDFRSDEEIEGLLEHTPTLRNIHRELKQRGLPLFYRWYMDLSQPEINELLQSFVSEAQKWNSGDLDQPEYWVRKAIDQFCTPVKIDRGILSFYLMNIVRLEPGEVIFQDSGIPHAYLKGQNVEIMANSDNVIRGGLTSKYMNAEALGKLVRFDARSIHRLQEEQVDHARVKFVPPAEEFQLSVIELVPEQKYDFHSSHISVIFSTCNCIIVQSATQEIRLGGGEAVLVKAGERLELQILKKSAKIFVVNAR